MNKEIAKSQMWEVVASSICSRGQDGGAGGRGRRALMYSQG